MSEIIIISSVFLHQLGNIYTNTVSVSDYNQSYLTGKNSFAIACSARDMFTLREAGADG